MSCRIACFLCVMLVSLPADILLAQAQDDWRPALTNQPTGAYPATPEFTLSVPALLSADDEDNLALELDGVDFSGIMEVRQTAAETIISASVPQALEAGSHELRLLVYTADGEIIEKGVWMVNVQGTAGEQDRVLQYPTNLEIGYLVDEDEFAESEDSLAANGDIRLNARASAGLWQLQGDAEMLVQTSRDEIAAVLSDSDADDDLFALQPNNDIELGDYLFRGDRPGMRAMVGHHALDGDNLLVSDFHRRGVSVNGQSGGGRVNGSMFAFRTEPVIGWRYGLGVGDEENRVLGAMASIRPLARNPERLTLRATALRGEGRDDTGIGIAGDEQRGEGDGMAVALESRLLDDRLRLLGEVAETDFTENDDADSNDDGQDGAKRILAEVIPWRGEGPNRSISLGAEFQQVDARFKSLANPTLPGDREMRRVYTDVAAGPITLRAQYARENDNVDEAADQATTENRIREFLLSYTPIRDGEADTPWFGRPSMSAGVRYTRSNGGEAGEDRETPYYHAEIGLQHDQWGLNLGVANGDEENLLTGELSSGSRSRSLNFHWFPSHRFFLFGQLQHDRFDSGPGLPVLDADIALLSAEISLVPDRLSLTLDASLNRNRDDGDLFDEETRTWGLGIDWQPARSSLRRTGTTFWLRAEEQQIRDRLDPSLDYDPWQVMAGIRLTLPGGSNN